MKGAVLYRHFSKSGELLYVGSSLHLLNRTYSHSQTASWFPQIATITVEHFQTKEEARRAEEKAIFNESPRENIVHHVNEITKRREKSQGIRIKKPGQSRKPHPQLDALVREFGAINHHMRFYLRCNAGDVDEIRETGRRLVTSEISALKDYFRTTYKRLAKIGIDRPEVDAADVRARHPEMQVKRLGNDCAARSD